MKTIEDFKEQIEELKNKLDHIEKGLKELNEPVKAYEIIDDKTDRILNICKLDNIGEVSMYFVDLGYDIRIIRYLKEKN